MNVGWLKFVAGYKVYWFAWMERLAQKDDTYSLSVVIKFAYKLALTHNPLGCVQVKPGQLIRMNRCAGLCESKSGGQ